MAIMATFEKGGQVSLAREKDPLVWPEIRTANVFRDPYPGWGAERVCRDLPLEWFDVDPEDRSPEDFLADLETGERVCLDCPLAVECRAQAVACKARGLFGAVVTLESGTTWAVDAWVKKKVGGKAPRKKAPEKAPELRECGLEGCGEKFTVSPKRAAQKYHSVKCGKAAKAQRHSVAGRTSAQLALAS